MPRSLSERAWFGQLEEAITHETWAPAMSTSILVVEDEPAIQELISVNLRHAGYQVACARSAEEAETILNAVFATTPTTGLYISVRQTSLTAQATVSLPNPVTPGSPGTRYARTSTVATLPILIWGGVTQP